MTVNINLTGYEIKICKQSRPAAEDALFLKTTTGRPVELLEFDTDYGRMTRVKGARSYISHGKGRQIVLDNYHKFRGEGKLLFPGDWELLNENRIVEKGIFSVTGDVCEMIGLISTTSDPL